MSFGKKFAKLNRANENTKVRAYYDFGDSRSKNSNEIKVGTQHRSRRANKHRGLGVSQYGRPPLKRRNQMLLTKMKMILCLSVHQLLPSKLRKLGNIA